MKLLMTTLAIAGLTAACTPNQQTNPTYDTEQSFDAFRVTGPQIRVLSWDERPLANAQILLGDALNAPFSGNFLTTDASGAVHLPAEWTSALSVTIEAPGFMRTTYFNQEPGTLTVKLRPLPQVAQREVRGTTPNLPVKDRDGIVDFGLVMPAFTKLSMLSFDIDKVISPQVDRITAVGQDMDIPANIALPKQSERYALFTVTLDKPQYRIYFDQPGVNKVFAARGRFPFKATVDGLRGGAAFYELINNFTITSGSVRDVQTNSSQTRVDLPTNELNFNTQRSMSAPSFRADEMFIAVAVTNQSGHFFPSDFKRLNSNQKSPLSVLANSEQHLLSVLKKADDMKNNVDRVSTALLPFKEGLNPAMLPILPDPHFNGSELLIPKINSLPGVHALATYAVLAQEKEIALGSDRIKAFQPQWEIYAHQWSDRLTIPQWPTDSATPGRKRWEINLVGSQSTSQAPLGPAMIEAATHVTHSSTTF